MTAVDDLSAAVWRKSTHSHENGECIEISDHLPGVVPVRDSKDPQGPALVFGRVAWAAFVGEVKAGRFAG